MHHRAIRFLRPALAAILIAGLYLCGRPLVLVGQGEKTERLIDQPAFDLVTLDKANDSKVLKVHPLDATGRKAAETRKGTARIKLLDDGREYDVAGSNIAKVEIFEQIVLSETNKLIGEGKLDEAYEYVAFLFNFYPQVQGLAETRQNFLYASAGAAFRQHKYEEALAVLEELMTLNPSYRSAAGGPTLLQVLGNIADPIISGYIEREDFRSARALLARLAEQRRADKEPFVQRWRQQLSDMATQLRDQARQDLAAGRFLEAHQACRRMQEIWPELAGVKELAAEVARQHPVITVGVEHPALSFDSRSVNNVAARRAGRLRERLLVELTGPGSEGGQYGSPLGTLRKGDDGRSLEFALQGEASKPSELMQWLLARATPGSADYNAAWGRIVSTVAVRGTTDVTVAFRTPSILPEALLEVPLGKRVNESPSPSAPFTVLSKEGANNRFGVNPHYIFRRPAQPAEIVERFYDDPQRALAAFKQGDVDLFDRIFPGDIIGLQTDSRLVVAPYQAPTTHVLVVRSSHPFLANQSFRRALVYGCNRELLLQQGLLRGRLINGFRVVSGPFPAPTGSGDVMAYGYDSRIQPRPYDPRLALTLRLLAEGEIKTEYEKQKKEPPKLTTLVLGHPADETSRIACRGLAKQWKLIGVDCKLVEFKPGVFEDTEKKCDVVYTQLAAWEPLVDAARLFGPSGLVPSASPFMQLALRQIEGARNWQEAREALLRLHRLVHEDVTVLPLWQTMDHFAYRRTLQGITPRRLSLYQDVEQWRPDVQLARSEP
jgi:hypothetical protein